jgi:stage III sporulation protein AG
MGGINLEEQIKPKHLFDTLKKTKNKPILAFILIFIIGFIILSFYKVINTSDSFKDSNENLDPPLQQKQTIDNKSYKDELEEKLSQILKEINGAGDVNVVITLENEEIIEPAFNVQDSSRITEEKDNEGGIRSITENQNNSQLVTVKKGGNEELVVLKKITPDVKGVLIVAEGACSSKVVEKLTKATATLLDLPVYKIQVFEK